MIVPAFNAADTIRETVLSALNQTYRSIEVIIVDDGSTDRTSEIVSPLMTHDPRVRYVHKENGGVASARNRGITEARGDFIATLDADDLWCPTKLAQQIARLEASGPDTALVYAWCCWISDRGDVTGAAPPTRLEGKIFRQMCLGNVIISGSNALIKREALIAAGGFDETLRARGAQGCEDWKLYLQIAKRHQIAMVPEYLIGYRISPGSMSDDFQQMMRSRRLIETEFIAAHPELAGQFARGEAVLACSLALRAIEQRQFRHALGLLTNLTRGRFQTGIASLIWLVAGLVRRILRQLNQGAHRVPRQFQSPARTKDGLRCDQSDA